MILHAKQIAVSLPDFHPFRRRSGSSLSRLLRILGPDSHSLEDRHLVTPYRVFAYAWKQRRILLTHDDDFWHDRRFPEHRHPGVVILPGANQRDMISGLVWMMQIMQRDPEQWLKPKVRITRDGDVYALAK